MTLNEQKYQLSKWYVGYFRNSETDVDTEGGLISVFSEERRYTSYKNVHTLVSLQCQKWPGLFMIFLLCEQCENFPLYAHPSFVVVNFLGSDLSLTCSKSWIRLFCLVCLGSIDRKVRLLYNTEKWLFRLLIVPYIFVKSRWVSNSTSASIPNYK